MIKDETEAVESIWLKMRLKQ